MNLRPLLFAGVVLAVSAALGQDLGPAGNEPVSAPGRFAVTVYSTADPALFDPQEFARYGAAHPDRTPEMPGYGVVREIRRMDLSAGENTLRYADVAAGIDPTTVAFLSLTAPDSTSVLEQSYEYDVVNVEKLLQKYVGRNVIINRRQQPLPDEKTRQPETIEGRLLSYDRSSFVLSTNNARLPVQIVPRDASISEIKLFDLQTGLVTRPTLVWKIRARQAGPHDVQVAYQTDGLTWRADYSVIVNKDDTAADLSAWVTILNQSGMSYPDAALKLVAGDARRLKSPVERYGVTYNAGGAGEREPQFTQQSFFDYHLYTLTRPTTIADNSTKQIELFPTRENVPVTKLYVYNAMGYTPRYATVPVVVPDRDYAERWANTRVDVYLSTKNSESKRLGLPLPAGRVRVYKRDADNDPEKNPGALEFVGEDLLYHTPKDEPILIRLGGAFDLVGRSRQLEFKYDKEKHVITERIEITLRNHKKTPVKINVRESLFRWVTWEITQASEKYEKQDSRTIQFPVDVPPDAEKSLTYTVVYTW